MKFNDFNSKPVKFKLRNGLNVELIYAPTLQTYVEYDIPLGSIHEKYKYNGKTYTLKPGIAHFLEHMMYMMDDHDAFETFHKLGVVANAMTTYRQTTYGIIGHKNMLEATLYLMNMIETPVFTSKRVNAEKSIIGEEIAMYDDEIDTIIQKKMFDQLIYNHPIKHEITGKKSDIVLITAKDLERSYNHFYKSNRRQLLILGPIDIEKFKAALLNYDSKIEMIEHPIILKNNEPSKVVVGEKTYKLKMSIGVLNVGIKMSLEQIDEVTLFKTEIMMLFLTRLLFGSGSNFHEHMTDENLMIDGFNFNVILEDETLIFMMDVETNNSLDLKTYVEERFFATDNSDLNASDFMDLKKAYKGHFMMALDDIENRLYLYGKYQLNGLSLEDAFIVLDQLTFDDILNFKNKITIEMFSYSHFMKND
jgi:predicted Zn-dependent peptidase